MSGRPGRAGQGRVDWGCGIRLGGAGIADVFRFCPGWKGAVHALIGRARRLRLGWDQEVPPATSAHLIRVPRPGVVCGLVPPVSWDELAARSGQDQRCKAQRYQCGIPENQKAR